MKTLSLLFSIVSLVFVISCTQSPVESQNGETIITNDLGSGISYVEPTCERDLTPDVDDGDVTKLITGNLDFALTIFRELTEQNSTADKNIFLSPYSISTICAMVSAGARGETERQIQNAMWFPFMGTKLHNAANALDLLLIENGNKNGVLKSSNSMWSQKDYSFIRCFIHTLAEQYGAGMYFADFAAQPEESRVAINELVSTQTDNRVTGLFPEGSIDVLTKLVLTNAVYFYSEWEYGFGEYNVKEPLFYLLDGSAVTVPLMIMSTLDDSTIKINYTSEENYEAVELPYKGKELSMVIVLPARGAYEQVETSFENNSFERILKNLSPEDVIVTMPKFTIDRSVELRQVLELLGMDAPFNETADFSGLTGAKDLYISEVFHNASISVDEKGTEATAVNGVTLYERSGCPKDFYANRPFIFFIKDNSTKTILFIGRVLNPAE